MLQYQCGYVCWALWCLLGFLVCLDFIAKGDQQLGIPQSFSTPSNDCNVQDRCPCGYCGKGLLRTPFLKKYRHNGSYILEVVRDILALHRNIIDFDTLKVACATFPAWVAGRTFDCALQSCFHCRLHHKNINQFGWWCREGAKWGIGAPIAALGSLAIFAPDDDLRTTSYVFLLGMPFVIFGKDVLKKLDFDACRRPWHEKFDCHERALGGFPSGHMAEAAYMAVLYGKRFGWKFGLPLGALAVFLGASFLNCNRHYFSQLVAGAGLGTVYALAADKLIDAKLRDDVRFTFTCNAHGNPQVGVRCTF